MGTPAIPPTLADRLSFPQLSPAEVDILKAWLRVHEKDFDRFHFNVRVGKGLDPGPTYDDATRAQSMFNTKKRIDAVAYKGAQAVVVEVKDRAGTTALGELLTYETLYVADHPNENAPMLLLVANTLQPDMQVVFDRFLILVQLVSG